MYIHLGRDVVVNQKYIVGIFDLETASLSKITRNFLAKKEKQGQVINVSDEIPKSFILYKDKEKTTLYISQISTATLLKRSGYLETIANV